MDPFSNLVARLSRMGMVKSLGMRVEQDQTGLIAVLPFHNDLIGNFTIQALHGGAIGAFLELTAMAEVILKTEGGVQPKTINLTIDYLRQGRAKDLHARAYITKLGRRIASVRAEAWQDNESEPVAALTAHFLIGTEEAADEGRTADP